MLRSRAVHVIAVVTLLVTGWSLFVADRALAIQDSEDKVWFGPVGVGADQAARINVFGAGSSRIGATVSLPATPWEFTVRIFNRRGDMVQERQLRVPSGAIASVEINIGDPDIFPVDRLGRRTMRAEIVGFNPQPDPPGRFGATLEVYSQRTGRTSILLGGPDTVPVQPPPDPELRQ